MNIYKLSEVYSSLLACDESFFSSLKKQDLDTCDKIATYFLGQKDQITKDDLDSLEERIVNYKEKKWKKDLLEVLFDKTLTSKEVFDKLHPATQHYYISDLPDELVSQYILPSAAEFSPQLVSKDWNGLAKGDEVWQAIAARISCPPPKAKQGELHQAVKEYVRDYRTMIGKLPEVTHDIEELLKGEMSVEKLLQLKEWKIARDTFVVKRELVKEMGLPEPKLANTSLIEHARTFPKWFKDNQAKLIILAFLDLRNKQLSSLPPEIGRFTYLRFLKLSNNQLAFLPPEIVQLPSLIELHLSNNQFTSLSDEVKALQLRGVFIYALESIIS